MIKKNTINHLFQIYTKCLYNLKYSNFTKNVLRIFQIQAILKNKIKNYQLLNKYRRKMIVYKDFSLKIHFPVIEATISIRDTTKKF